MTSIRRTWLLWLAGRYRKRAAAAVTQAHTRAIEWRERAEQLELEAEALARRQAS